MRKKRNYMKKNGVFIKFMRYMILILIIPLIISFVLYGRFTEHIHEQLYLDNVNALENSSVKMENVFQGIEKIVTYFTRNVSIVNYIMDTEGSQKKHIYMLRAQKELDAMKIANDDLVDIQLYSAKSDSLIDFLPVRFIPIDIMDMEAFFRFKM